MLHFSTNETFLITFTVCSLFIPCLIAAPQLRHFELTGMTLRFFKSEADKQPIGCITCQDISSITSGDDMAASRE